MRDTRLYRYLFVRHGHNWRQLIKFSIVGGTGLVVNLAVYSVLHSLGVHYMVAAVPSFIVANINNYVLNRYWTFPRTVKRAVDEYWRFLVIGLVALALNELLLYLFVEHGGLDAMVGQAAAVILVTPVGFVGNKLWTFRGKL